MKILVTGAAGFIGFFVSQGLLARGDEVVGLDNLNDYYDPKLKAARLDILRQHKNFRFVKLDLADRGGIEVLFAAEKFTRVIHLAAQAGVRHSLEKLSPGKKFYFVRNEQCNCSECPYMKRNTLEKLRDALRDLEPRVELTPELMVRARAPIERMLAVR